MAARIFLAILFTVLSALSGSAQTLSVKPHFTVGDTFTVEISHVRSNSTRPESNAKARNLNQVRVVETGPTGSLLEWVEGPVDYDDPAQVGNPVVAGASKALDNLRLMVKLNARGEFTELQNEAVVSKQLLDVAEKVVKSVTAEAPADQRAGLEVVVRQMMQPAALLSSATRDIQMYFSLHGVEIEAAKPVETTVHLPNPISGTPIQAKLRIRLESANNLTVQTIFNASEVQAAMTELISKAAPGSPVPTVEVQDGGKYVYAPAPGLMQSVTYTRKVKAGPQIRTDEWQMTLVKSSNL
ncbi:MAG: hypothetical protein ABIR70_19890 [Bryobacteraceae bacterium]